MTSFVRVARAAAACAALGLAVLSIHSDARACGGCFHPQAEVGSSVITDHRMVFKISTEETILWDQVRYSGDPTEFAWVLPVHEGARVELSRDEWIAALDASTKTIVKGPERSCGGGGGGGGSGGGCSSSTTLTGFSAKDSNGGSGGDFEGNSSVKVIAQSVIGPYQAVTIRATGTTGISAWLADNGFAIPAEVRPIVDAYTAERFDFIALKLRPGAGVRAMKPVRVVTPGADASMPLRMVTAGVGSHVGLTLWVIGEGRYRTQNFPDAVVDYGKLVWDGRASRSNLSDLQAAALAANGGRGWLTEAAVRADVTGSFQSSVNAFVSGVDPSLHDAYLQTCITRPPITVPCDETALPPSDGKPDETDAGADAGDADAGDDAGADAGDAAAPDAGETRDDGGTSPGSQCTKVVSGCDGFDDLDVATRGLHDGDVWVTRLRADLPVTALATDLRLEASPDQTEASPVHTTDTFSDPSFDPCAGVPGASPRDSGGCACRSTRALRGDAGTLLVIGLTALGIGVVSRRRRR